MNRFVAWLVLSVLPLTVCAQGAPVQVVTAQQEDVFRQVALTGTVTAEREAMVSVAVSGLIASIPVQAGQRVTKGDVLLTLDDELARIDTRRAAARALQRKTAWQDAQRRLREAKALERNIAESTVRNLTAEIAEDEALWQEAQAEEAYQQALLARHQIRAPFDGVVSRKHGEVGEWVNPGQTVIELVALAPVRLDFNVAEDYLAQINEKARLRYTLKAFPGQVFEAPVGTIVPVSDPSARTVLLRVPVANEDQRLIPGLSVSAQLQVPTGRSSLVIPRDATVRTPDGRVIVWTLRQDGEGLRAVENSVETGLVFNGHVEIQRGIAAGERVVVLGNEALQQNQQVHIAHD